MGRPVTFTFRCPRARSVALAGDFNGWSVSDHPMRYDPTEDVWTATIVLDPGRYEYKFFVDAADWWNDRDAPKVANVWGSENSYLDVE
jgi:1,4-alpha-glucan branching enzyme